MNRIRFLRMQRAMKQEELARVIHVSQSSLSGYENEKYEPDKKTLLRLASFFGVSVDYLLGIDHLRSNQKKSPGKIPVYSLLRFKSASGPCGPVLYFLNFEPFGKIEGEYFGLLVRENRMEPRIFEGDIAIVRRQGTIESGEIAAIQLGQENAVVARVAKCESGIALVPYNPKYSIVSYSNREMSELPVTILGKVVEFRGKC